LRRDLLYLSDIAHACRKIERFIDNKTFEEFAQDDVLFDATVRNLQNIGEAVRALSQEVRDIRPDVQWTRIVGLRHLLVHQYFGVDEEIVWDVAKNKCPVLVIAVEDILSKLPEA
jgi:uncharacterized protein with HEPN domain